MIKLQKELEIINFKLVLYCYVGNKNEKQGFNHFEYQYILFIGQNSHFFAKLLFEKKLLFFFPSHQGIL